MLFVPWRESQVVAENERWLGPLERFLLILNVIREQTGQDYEMWVQ